MLGDTKIKRIKCESFDVCCQQAFKLKQVPQYCENILTLAVIKQNIKKRTSTSENKKIKLACMRTGFLKTIFSSQKSALENIKCYNNSQNNSTRLKTWRAKTKRTKRPRRHENQHLRINNGKDNDVVCSSYLCVSS